jgi:hypothetical protein
MIVSIAEAYELAGVVHSEQCQVCNLIPEDKTVKSRSRKINVLIIIAIVIELWVVAFHLDWIIGGLPK